MHFVCYSSYVRKSYGVFYGNSIAEHNPLISEFPAFLVPFMCHMYVCVRCGKREVSNWSTSVLVLSYIPNVSTIHITFDISNRITAAPQRAQLARGLSPRTRTKGSFRSRSVPVLPFSTVGARLSGARRLRCRRTLSRQLPRSVRERAGSKKRR